MTSIPFDSLGYFEKLKAVGVPEEQAKVYACLAREQTELQNAALRDAIKQYDEARRKDLSTKGDVQDVRNEIQQVRNELKTEIKALRNDIINAKYEIFKWMVTGMLAQAALLVGIIAFLK